VVGPGHDRLSQGDCPKAAEELAGIISQALS
jgi:hypothetical protein